MPRYYCDYCDAYLTHDSVGCEMVWEWRHRAMVLRAQRQCTLVFTREAGSLQVVVRKQHNSGYKHKANVKAYYGQFEEAMQQMQMEAQARARMVGREAWVWSGEGWRGVHWECKGAIY